MLLFTYQESAAGRNLSAPRSNHERCLCSRGDPAMQPQGAQAFHCLWSEIIDSQSDLHSNDSSKLFPNLVWVQPWPALWLGGGAAQISPWLLCTVYPESTDSDAAIMARCIHYFWDGLYLGGVWAKIRHGGSKKQGQEVQLSVKVWNLSPDFGLQLTQHPQAHAILCRHYR